MRYRFLTIVIVVSVFLGLIILPRFIKRDFSQEKLQSEPKGQIIKSININSYLKEAESFVEQGSLFEAKEIYQRLMETPLPSKQMGIVQNRLEDLNIKILLNIQIL